MERSITFVSKTLNAAERSYSQIEREAFSIIFGVKKLHQYQRQRLQMSDGFSAAVAYLGPRRRIPVMAVDRFQRWVLILAGCSYNIEFKPTATTAKPIAFLVFLWDRIINAEGNGHTSLSHASCSTPRSNVFLCQSEKSAKGPGTVRCYAKGCR